MGVFGAGVTGLLGLILLGQYGPVLKYRKRLPPVDLGVPILGHTMNILKNGWSGGGRSWLRHLQAKHGPAYVFNLLFVNRVAVDYPLYEKYMQDLERKGKLRPLFSKSMQRLLGQKSVLTLPGGKGGALHAKVRQKIAPALTSAQLALMAPQVEAMCRLVLEEMAQETETTGQTALLPMVDRLTQDVAAASLLGSFADPDLPYLGRLRSQIETIVEGLFTIPVEKFFGKLSPFGKAMQAKVEACKIVDELLELARAGKAPADGLRKDVLTQLAQTSDDGEALTAEEIHDSVVTMAFAGKVTAAAVLPVAVTELARRPEWGKRIAEEAPDFEKGVEHPRPALQFIREAMRLKPPAAAFYRGSDDWIDLGEHGAVPPGMPVAVCMDYPKAGLGGAPDEFNPERWTEEHARKHFIYFGGTTPHTCPGRGLALLEMQIFMRLLVQEYDFEVLSEETFVDRAITQVKYKDGLPMRVRRKSVEA